MEARAVTQVEAMEDDERPTSAEPRVAAAAEPHKRRAVAAETAVGETFGVGGRPPPEMIDVGGGGPAAASDTDATGSSSTGGVAHGGR
eukprot:413659-Prymnesium_polylepis.1